MAALEREASGPNDESLETQKGTLVDFHKRLGHLNYEAVERLVRDPSSGITLTDHRRVNCLTSAQGKQTQNPTVDERHWHSRTDRQDRRCDLF
ncbi:hypothetical protein PI124_g8069 [Phytophthora idaei]|nr:hypothetical protein PI125_g10359 [Phytophthora idaei]KAG3129491.1 hypothetical protein PI126_g20949 [Phytophthora idaei]KAG3247205.1 hypothetical protein PI124_g8069 [Phytophthora idaei]